MIRQLAIICQRPCRLVYMNGYGHVMASKSNATLSYNGQLPENYYAFMLNLTADNYPVIVLTSSGIVQESSVK